MLLTRIENVGKKVSLPLKKSFFQQYYLFLIIYLNKAGKGLPSYFTRRVRTILYDVTFYFTVQKYYFRLINQINAFFIMNNNFPGDKTLMLLKTQGPLSLAALAKEMKVTTVAVRFKLLKLASEGLVEANTIAKGRGRPQQIWSLTGLGHAGFSDNHASLTVRLITIMRETLGEEAIASVIDASAKKMVSKYLSELQPYPTLEGKINKLAEIRNQEGYMAEYKKEGNGFLLIENHCPICAAATACQQFCKSELSVFTTVLGGNVKVKRVDHILVGARRCAYSIQCK
jgi:predicted ArsR family transcriptional regulator